MIEGYRKRLSGPIMDRIDIHVDVPAVDDEQLSGETLGEPSTVIRTRGVCPRPTGGPLSGSALTCIADMGPAPRWRVCGYGNAALAPTPLWWYTQKRVQALLTRELAGRIPIVGSSGSILRALDRRHMIAIAVTLNSPQQHR